MHAARRFRNAEENEKKTRLPNAALNRRAVAALSGEDDLFEWPHQRGLRVHAE